MGTKVGDRWKTDKRGRTQEEIADKWLEHAVTTRRVDRIRGWVEERQKVTLPTVKWLGAGKKR